MPIIFGFDLAFVHGWGFSGMGFRSIANLDILLFSFPSSSCLCSRERRGGREEGRKGGREEGRKGGREDKLIYTILLPPFTNRQLFQHPRPRLLDCGFRTLG
jgi:hypothetical protein